MHAQAMCNVAFNVSTLSIPLSVQMSVPCRANIDSPAGRFALAVDQEAGRRPARALAVGQPAVHVGW